MENLAKNLLRVAIFSATGLGLLTAWACSSYGASDAGKPSSPSVTPEKTQTLEQLAYEEAPKLFNEAPTPKGWPALTPVNQIRVKQYPAYRAAVITADQDQSGSDNGLFRPLFNHIKRQDIAMTAPVEMTYADNGKQNAMAFLYRTADMGTAGADADDQRIDVRDVPEMTALSIGIQGRYSHDRFSNAVDKLNQWLNDNKQWAAAGEPRYLGYNSPFVPTFLRYGEVQIPIKPSQ